MAMTYAQSAALMQDPDFRARVKVSALTYAQYLSLEVSNSNAKMRWIQSTMSAPDQMAVTLVPPTVMNPNVQADGPTISDANLQAAVQAVADMMM